MTHPARVAEGPKSRWTEWLNCSFMWDDEQVHRTSREQRPRPLPNTNWRKCSGQRKPVGRQGEQGDAFIFWIARLGHSAKFKKNLANVSHCTGTDRRMFVTIKSPQKKENWDCDDVTSSRRKEQDYTICNMARVWKYSDPSWHGNGQRAALFSVFCYEHSFYIASLKHM